jgi:undecaprenyl diphosphate synthase
MDYFNKINNYKIINFSSSITDIFDINRHIVNTQIYNLYKSNIDIIEYINNQFQLTSVLNTKIMIINSLLYYLNILNNTDNNIHNNSLIILSLIYLEKNSNELTDHHFNIFKLTLQNKDYITQTKLEYFIQKITKEFISLYNITINNTIFEIDSLTFLEELNNNIKILNNDTIKLFEIFYLILLLIKTNNKILLQKINTNVKIFINNINKNFDNDFLKIIKFIFDYILLYLNNKYYPQNNDIITDTNLFLTIINKFINKYFTFYKELIHNTISHATNIPNFVKSLHLGVILDGNRRYARKYNHNYDIGYLDGAKTVKKLIDWCIKLQCISELTLYVFSLDNYTKRNDNEKKIIYNIIATYYEDLLPFFTHNNIKINCIGDLDIFPTKFKNHFDYIKENTQHNTGLILNLAIGYDGQIEIINAVKQSQLHNKTINTIQDLNKYMTLQNNIDLVIRTGGMKRSSNFFIWQTSYSEWYFLDKLWPEFEYHDLTNILQKYKNTPKNYGK